MVCEHVKRYSLWFQLIFFNFSYFLFFFFLLFSFFFVFFHHYVLFFLYYYSYIFSFPELRTRGFERTRNTFFSLVRNNVEEEKKKNKKKEKFFSFLKHCTTPRTDENQFCNRRRYAHIHVGKARFARRYE